MFAFSYVSCAEIDVAAIDNMNKNVSRFIIKNIYLFIMAVDNYRLGFLSQFHTCLVVQIVVLPSASESSASTAASASAK